jgi:hypothetical protein
MTTAKKKLRLSNEFPVERLWELYDFNPLTGYLISRTGPNKGKPIIGYLQKNKGAWLIKLFREDGTILRTNYARVVFAWCKGRWPEGSVDHIDREPRNNRIWNLREADSVLQNQNTSCFNYGACWNKSKKKWQSQISTNGEVKYLGNFDSQRSAQEAYIRTCKEIGRPLLEPVLVDGRYIPVERL